MRTIRGTRSLAGVVLDVWLLLLSALFLVSPAVRADTTYLQAEFDDAQPDTGSGPLATAGPWDPAGVAVGSASLVNEDSSTCSVYVDPLAALGGSAQGLHFVDVHTTPEASVMAFLYPDPTLIGPTDSSTYWIDYRFTIDPDQTDKHDGDIIFWAWDENAGNVILYTWAGWWTVGNEPYFRYTINYNGGNVKALNLTPIDADDEWRVLIEVDPVNQEQTHWLWKNGQTLTHAILGVPHSLRNNQTRPLKRLLFQSNRSLQVEYSLDEVFVRDSGPPIPPAGLKAAPKWTDEISLSWQDMSDDEAGFKIERSLTGDGGWTEIATVSADVESYLDTGLTSKTKYYYRVASYGGGGISPWSNTASALTVYTGKPLSDWISVTDFGANGQDQLDDTQALQTALNALDGWWGSSSPHVLYFPNGTYRVSDTLFVEGHVGLQFVGQSTNGVVIQWHGPPGTVDGRRADGARFLAGHVPFGGQSTSDLQKPHMGRQQHRLRRGLRPVVLRYRGDL
jgi:hypothetical protein